MKLTQIQEMYRFESKNLTQMFLIEEHKKLRVLDWTEMQGYLRHLMQPGLRVSNICTELFKAIVV